MKRLCRIIKKGAVPLVILFIITILSLSAVVVGKKGTSNIGEHYIKNKKYEKALQCFNKRLVEYPNDYNALVGKGKALYNLEKYEEAIEVYKKVLEKNSNNKEAQFDIGCLYYNLGKYKEALNHFEEAEKLDNKAWNVLEWKAYSLVRLGEYDKAFAICDKLIKEGDNDYLVKNCIGLIHLGKGNYQGAIEQFQLAIHENNLYEDAYLNKLEALYCSDEIEKCKRFCDDMAKLFPKNYEVNLYRGDCFSAEGQYEKAIKQYEIGLKSNKNVDEIYCEIAMQHFYLEQYDIAKSFVNKALALNAKNEYAIKVKGQIDKGLRPDKEKIIEFVKNNYLYIDKVKNFDEKCKVLSNNENLYSSDVEKFISSIRVPDDRFTYVVKNVDYNIMQVEDKTKQIDTKSIGTNVEIVKIHSFTSRVGEEFKAVIDKISTPETKILVLDLRDNGGGYSRSANYILDLLLSKCTTVSFSTRDGKEKKYFSEESQVKFKKIIVWVNEKSASSSEVLALSLKKHLDNVTIIGTPTYGKPVGQLIYESKKQKYMFFLVNFYWSVEGENILDKKVNPDIIVNSENDIKYEEVTLNISNGKQ